MRALALAVVLAALAGPARAVDTCVECHVAQKDPYLSRQVKAMADDVHTRAGLSCHSCHGGDPTTGMDDPYESMDPKKGYLGIPKVSQLAAFCTRCHADAKFMRDHAPRLPVDQLAKYQVSMHARSAAQDAKGAASCTACHKAHGILGPADPRSRVNALNIPQTCGRCHSDNALMTGFNLPSDSVTDYLQSVHWEAAKTRNDRTAPVCHDCHGNHATAAPQPTAIPGLCGRCHSAELTAFGTGKHAKLTGFSGCVECHSNHKVLRASEALLEPAGACAKCHQQAGRAEDDHARAEAAELHDTFAGLEASLARVGGSLEALTRFALPTADVEEDLRTAREKLIAARRLVHTDDLPAIRKAAAESTSAIAHASETVDQRLAGLAKRKWGGVLVGLLALATAITLVVRARELAGAHPPVDDDQAPSV